MDKILRFHYSNENRVLLNSEDFVNFALSQLILALQFDRVKTCLFQITSHFTELPILVTLSQETSGELHAVYLSH